MADGINSAKDVTIKTKEDANASLDVSSGAEAAIFGENVTVESGKLTATGKNLPAIKADKTVTIAGGTVKANVTGDAEELPAAVTAATIKIQMVILFARYIQLRLQMVLWNQIIKMYLAQSQRMRVAVKLNL